MGRALSKWAVKYDELAFLNQQLAGMLKAGIPLEAALRQLCLSMRRGRLRSELEALQADLTQGTPLESALAGRRLPDFYKEMVRVGAKSNNLPAILTLLADYYQRVHALWTRLKTLLIYPLIVLVILFRIVVSAGRRLRAAVGRSGNGAGLSNLRRQSTQPDDFCGGDVDAVVPCSGLLWRRFWPCWPCRSGGETPGGFCRDSKRPICPGSPRRWR